MNFTKFINIHSHINNNQNNVVTIFNKIIGHKPNNLLFYSAGIHPWFINEREIDLQLKELKKAVQKKNCLAIGECGLDSLKGSESSIQEHVFNSHILLASEIKKPLIIHNVKKTQRIHEMISINKYKGNLIFHGVNSETNYMHKLNENDSVFFSFGKALFNEKSNASKLLKELPLNKIFLETDDSDFSITAIYEQAIKILKIDSKEFIHQISQNFNFVFNYGNY